MAEARHKEYKIMERKPEDKVKSVFFCCFCAKKNLEIKASHYCINCQSYFCKTCVDIHEVVPSLADHSILEEKDFNREDPGHPQVSDILPFPLTRCSEHPGKIVDMYCRSHDKVECTACMAVKHDRFCERIYIPSNIEKLFEAEEIEEVEQKLSNLVFDLKKSLELQKTAQSKLCKTEEKALRGLLSFINEMKIIVEHLQTKNSGALTDLVYQKNTEMQREINQLENAVENAEQVLNELKQANLTKNLSHQYVSSKMAAQSYDQCKKIQLNFKLVDVEDISFHPPQTSKEIFQDYLSDKWLGEFSVKMNKKELVRKLVKVDREEGSVTCHFTGSCSTEENTYLLTDNSNYNLRRFELNDSTTKSDTLKLTHKPWDVCMINPRKAGVTLPALHRVQFISLGSKMRLTSSMEVQYECYAVTCHDLMLYLSNSNNAVNVYTLGGEFLRQFSNDPNGLCLFSDIRKIVPSLDGQELYIAEGEQGLLKLDLHSGQVIKREKGGSLKWASDICNTWNNRILVCDTLSATIVQIQENGELQEKISTKIFGHDKPLSICFNENTSMLLVTQAHSDSILLFELER